MLLSLQYREKVLYLQNKLFVIYKFVKFYDREIGTPVP